MAQSSRKDRKIRRLKRERSLYLRMVSVYKTQNQILMDLLKEAKIETMKKEVKQPEVEITRIPDEVDEAPQNV